MILSSTELLTPRAKIKIETMLEVAKMEGLDVYCFETKRHIERQYELFGKWRTEKELEKYGVPKKYAAPRDIKITWTIKSKHLTWEAADIVFDRNKDPKVKVPSWSGDYSRLVEIWEACWLDNLRPIELCHFQDNWSSVKSQIIKNGDSRHATKIERDKNMLHKVNSILRAKIAQ